MCKMYVMKDKVFQISKTSYRIFLVHYIRRANPTFLRTFCSIRPSLQGPGLTEFLAVRQNEKKAVRPDDTPYLNINNLMGRGQRVYLEVYGCQMNVNDAEIVLSILTEKGYNRTTCIEEADVLMLLTCAIREGAEGKVWDRLRILRGLKKKGKTKKNLKIALLGCMAERLKHKVLEIDKSVDLVAGPDSYKDLPRLLALTHDNQTAVNVQLSADETYADVMPVRINPNSVSAYVSIMRGCDNMCTYCIVPFTRGRERSRPISSIIEEVKHLSNLGVKEVTLLGQNVNSYRDTTFETEATPTHLAVGFSTVYKAKVGGVRFARLLEAVARVDPDMRVRFTSPHPKDFPDEVLDVISAHPNVCCSLHLPAQSGNDAVLQRMRRGYTREAYLALVARVRTRLPGVSLSSDFIAGFCGETEAEFEDTLTLLAEVRYSIAYLFAYSMREKTTAHRRFEDNVPQDVKNRRVSQMVQVFRDCAKSVNEAQIGQKQLVLVEGTSKRDAEWLAGRNDGNTKVIIPRRDVVDGRVDTTRLRPIRPGDYVAVLINAASSQTLKGVPINISSVSEFSNQSTND